MPRKTIVVISDDDVKVIIEDNEAKKPKAKTKEPQVSTRSVRTGGKRTPP
jgi:hypothetical protein